MSARTVRERRAVLVPGPTAARARAPRAGCAHAAGARSRPPGAGLRVSRWPRVVRSRLGGVVGAAILGVVVWRLGTGALVDGLARIDAGALLAALGIGVVTTVFSAWRWTLVGRGLGLRVPLRPAVADYYRALFLNAALPGGVLGDVHRAVRHGHGGERPGRGAAAVLLERVAGQLALLGVGAVVLLSLPSPVMTGVRQVAPLVVAGLAGAVAVAVALRPHRSSAASAGSLRARLGTARAGLMPRRGGAAVALSSLVVLAGHLTMFVLAARVAGTTASVAALLPLAVLALLAMALPLNVGGWGPREGATAWAFGAAGLGAGQGLTVAVVYGVLCLAASLPGSLVLLARRGAWRGARRGAARTVRRIAGPPPNAAGPARPPREGSATASGPGTNTFDGTDRAAFAAGATGGAPVPGRPSVGAQISSRVTTSRQAPKESTRLASSSSPFRAEASEGRPTTPDRV
nr:lysylphosphatidylglycerol synthase transmembrane domain-containing protein [Streptomyces sp. HSG2]